MLQFIEAQLIILNPICPHFAEYCWTEHVLPAFKRLGSQTKESQLLIDQRWVKTREVD